MVIRDWPRLQLDLFVVSTAPWRVGLLFVFSMIASLDHVSWCSGALLLFFNAIKFEKAGHRCLLGAHIISLYQVVWLVVYCAPDRLLGFGCFLLRPAFYRLLVLQQVLAGDFLFFMAGKLGNLGVSVTRYLTLGDLIAVHLFIRYNSSCTRAFIFC